MHHTLRVHPHHTTPNLPPPHPYYPISQSYLLPLVTITPFSVEKESLGRPCIFQSRTHPTTPLHAHPHHTTPNLPQTPPIPPHHIPALPASAGYNHTILCREGITGQTLHIPITHTPTCPPSPHNPQSSPTPPILPYISILPAAAGNNHTILSREGITGQTLHIPITHTPTCPPSPHNPQASPTPPTLPYIPILPAASGYNHTILCREGITGQTLYIPVTHNSRFGHER